MFMQVCSFKKKKKKHTHTYTHTHAHTHTHTHTHTLTHISHTHITHIPVNFSLFDRTENDKVLFSANASHTISPVTGEKLLVETSFYSSSIGIEIYPNHVYGLIAWYNNTTPNIVDGMAVMRVLYA